jgi:hypothetical protein
MPVVDCPHCGVLGNFVHVWSGDVALGYPRRSERQFAALVCPNEYCRKPVGAVIDSRVGAAAIYDTWPTHVGGKQFPDVPTEIASTADEAHRCFSIHAYRAAMSMARAVVEATAKEKGITTGNLEGKIDELSARGFIRNDTKDAAHAVRLVGNDAAHGDVVAIIVDEGDAKDVLDLMDDILHEVFQSPAKVARVKANRAARKAAAKDGPSR